MLSGSDVECGGSTPLFPAGSTAVSLLHGASGRAIESGVEPPHSTSGLSKVETDVPVGCNERDLSQIADLLNVDR